MELRLFKNVLHNLKYFLSNFLTMEGVKPLTELEFRMEVLKRYDQIVEELRKISEELRGIKRAKLVKITPEI